MWKANGKTTTLSLFLDSLFPETNLSIALSGGIILDEAVDLSSDRLPMMMMILHTAHLGIEGWRRKAKDRDQWRRISQEAKAHVRL
jgi:hypothetical protein